MTSINDLKCDLEDKDFRRNEPDEDNISFNSDEAKEVVEKYKELQFEFDRYKRETELKESNYYYEKEKLKKDIESITNTYKANIQELEKEILKLKNDIADDEVDRMHLEKEITNDADNKNYLYSEIENYQNQIRILEDLKEKTEFKYKEHINQLQIDIKDLDNINTQLRESLAYTEKEFSKFKENYNKHIKEKEEKHRIEINFKDKEINELKQRIDTINKDYHSVKKEYDFIKQNSEKTRIEYKELSENLKKIKENNEIEMKKWEEKYFILEKRLEKERNVILEQNRELQCRLNEKGSFNETNNHIVENSLSNVLNDDNTGSSGQKVVLLQEEINSLVQKLSEANSKLKLDEKKSKEIEILSKENSSLKANLKEMKLLYETQIEALQQKAYKISNELQSNRKRSTSRGETTLTPKQMQMLAELEATIKRLQGENKYLSEKLDIQNKEIDNLKQLKEKDIEFLREEVRKAEEQAVNAKVTLATVSFEKDSELIKYKNLYQKLKLKVQGGAK